MAHGFFSPERTMLFLPRILGKIAAPANSCGIAALV